MPIVIALLIIIVMLLGGGPILLAIFVAPMAALALILTSTTVWVIVAIWIVLGVCIVISRWAYRSAARAEEEQRTREANRQREEMLSASHRIEENLYRHPDGRFIAVGPNNMIKFYKTERGARGFLARFGVAADNAATNS